jgi:ribosomal protein S18 acetylase RimI-like enzyme
MSRPRLATLTAAGLSGLPPTCPDCVLGPAVVPGLERDAAPATWVRGAEADWGFCGVTAHHEDQVVGYLLVTSPLHVPRTGPQSGGGMNPDAAVVMTVRVLPAYADSGVGRQLVQAAAARLTRTQFAALEARASIGPGVCTLPSVDFLQSVGFTRIDDHPLTPRMRLDFSRTVRWMPDFRPAWDRLVGWAFPVPPQPAGRAPAERRRSLGSRS